ncbi:MAG: tetratricopeptide repeat protein [Betaproteobacteria bacterium]|nr:tetratricopeptide repeat protein [Betaproteobacteria bacterium]
MLEQAVALHRAGRLAEAAGLYRSLLAAQPGHRDALRLLGTLEAQRGNLDEARRLVARLQGVGADTAAAHAHLGDLYASARQFDAALACYDRALALDPRLAVAQFNRALALHTIGRHADAVAGYDALLAVDPGSADAWNNRGGALAALRRFDEALASFDRALALRPGFAQAGANRAAALQEAVRAGRARSDDALAAADGAVAAAPQLAEARVNRGTALRDMGRTAEALADYDAAAALEPGLAAAHLNRGMALAALARHQEAVSAFDRAVALEPRSVAALTNRGVSLAWLKRNAEATRDFARALEVDPARPAVAGLWLHARANCCDWDGYDEAVHRIIADVRAGRRVVSPLPMLALTDGAQDQSACARTWVRDTMPAAPVPLWRGERYDHARIRVAYLSADFGEHAVAYLMAGVFEAHDRDRFEIIAIASGPGDGGPMRARVRAAFERFVDVGQKSDRDVAALLRELEVDLAVDLNGHTLGSRTGALAWRPAPVQVSYLGFPGTSGADYVDYVLADRFVIPAAQRAQFTEKVVWLPDVFQANDRKRAIAARAPARAEAGLPDRAFVFCAFGNSYKITPAVFGVWMRLLQGCDGSVLWLLGGETATVDNLRREARARGVDPERLAFAPRLPYAQHLARYRLADLFLDTLPFNGGATVSDALWAGLPVLTCAGEAMAARMGGSLLRAVGLPELVTASLADYEATAALLAREPGRLAALKATLARNRDTCPLFDTQRHCRHLEAAYAAMHERQRRGAAPESFAV